MGKLRKIVGVSLAIALVAALAVYVLMPRPAVRNTTIAVQPPTTPTNNGSGATNTPTGHGDSDSGHHGGHGDDGARDHGDGAKSHSEGHGHGHDSKGDRGNGHDKGGADRSEHSDD
jgi:hypothetical protein